MSGKAGGGGGLPGSQAEDLLGEGGDEGRLGSRPELPARPPLQRGRDPCPVTGACSAAWLCSNLLVVGGRDKAGRGSLCAWPNLP